MQRIEVQNFGPIKNVTLDIKDYMIFIGPQASGKSTLAKLVWLYHDVIDLISFQYNILLYERSVRYTDYKYVLKFFLPTDGTSLYIDKSYIKPETKIIFYYNENTYFDLIGENVSANLDKILLDIFEEYKRVRKLRLKKDISFEQSNIIRDNFYNDVRNILENATNTMAMSVNFIPAGRMVEFYKKSENQYNYFLDFVMKQSYATKKSERINVNFEKLKHQILKGIITIKQNKSKKTSLEEYSPVISGKDFEVSIQQASSGQQAATGIILVIDYLLKQKTANYTIIEEPEAHLFPEAQRDLTYLISLLANQDHNQVLLTTHSPYILAALNNLMKAHTVGQMTDNESAVNDIIARELWVNPAQVFVGYMENGEIRNIINPELQQIEHDCLDNVSTDIMTKFDQLLDIQYA